MPAETTLARCPFCGSHARRSQGGEDPGAWFGTGCDGAQGCPAYLRGLTFRTQAAADEAWNRRAPQAHANIPAPLTPERIDELAQTAFMDYMADRNDDSDLAFARAIEAEHGIR